MVRVSDSLLNSRPVIIEIDYPLTWVGLFRAFEKERERTTPLNSTLFLLENFKVNVSKSERQFNLATTVVQSLTVSEECWTRKERAGRDSAMLGPVMPHVGSPLWWLGNCICAVMGQEQSTAVGPLDWPSQGQSEDVGCCKRSLYCTFSPRRILAPKLTYIRIF